METRGRNITGGVLIALLLTLLYFSGQVNADVIVQKEAKFELDGTGDYIAESQFNCSTITVNSTTLNISGTAATDDLFFINSSTLYQQDKTEFILSITAADEYFRIKNFLNTTVINMTGSFTSMTVCYNDSSSPINITLNMDNLSGDCNYKATSGNVLYVQFPRSLTDLANCSLRLETNGTGGVFCPVVAEDEAVSETNIADIIAAATVAITGILASQQWTTRSD